LRVRTGVMLPISNTEKYVRHEIILAQEI